MLAQINLLQSGEYNPHHPADFTGSWLPFVHEWRGDRSPVISWNYPWFDHCLLQEPTRCLSRQCCHGSHCLGSHSWPGQHPCCCCCWEREHLGSLWAGVGTGTPSDTVLAPGLAQGHLGVTALPALPQREESKECTLQGAGIDKNVSLQGPGWAGVIVPSNLGCSRAPVMAAVVSGVFTNGRVWTAFQELSSLCLTIQLQGLLNSQDFWDKGLGTNISLGITCLVVAGFLCVCFCRTAYAGLNVCLSFIPYLVRNFWQEILKASGCTIWF